MFESEENLLCYLAGLFDGEGTLTFRRHRPRNNRQPRDFYTIAVQVAMCNELSIRLFESTFGGNVYHYNPRNPRFRESWLWYLRVSELQEFLTKMIPYLILKKPHAEIALNYLLNLRNRRGKKVTVDNLVLREAQYILMKELNKRGNKV